ncbi:unnamed protein product [Mytilus edulis]|uniref:Uncharacterized protein n=1 Tax=Mytilus edulis TaxID=6550 RepID=A0A8S3UMG3_MYTED|nr:unnamed protein product [Mytilus edulis]
MYDKTEPQQIESVDHLMYCKTERSVDHLMYDATEPHQRESVDHLMYDKTEPHQSESHLVYDFCYDAMIQHLLENANTVYVLHMRQQGVIRVRLGTAEYHQSQTWDKKESLKSDMGQHCVIAWSQIWDNIVSLESDTGQFGVIEVRPGTAWWYENQTWDSIVPFEAAMGLNGFIRLRQWTVWCHWSQELHSMESLKSDKKQYGVIGDSRGTARNH